MGYPVKFTASDPLLLLHSPAGVEHIDDMQAGRTVPGLLLLHSPAGVEHVEVCSQW